MFSDPKTRQLDYDFYHDLAKICEQKNHHQSDK
ncbi:MAG: hypothetical protein ACTTME_01875 [Arsenophonus sp.]